LVRRGTLFAGAIRPGAALFVPRVRESYTLHVVTKLVAAQKHGVDVGEEQHAHGVVVGEKHAHGVVGEDAAISTVPDLSGPLASRVL
jgi:hypothetical protein